jgi:hypothetical protein
MEPSREGFRFYQRTTLLQNFMEQISERTWVLIGAVVAAGPALLLYAVVVFPLHAAGVVFVSVSDVTRDLRGITEVAMTVQSIELYSPIKGWVPAVTAPTTFGLLALRKSGAMQLAGKAEVAAGLYTQVRVTLGPVEVHTADGHVHEAALGSRTFVINANTVVNKDAASHINIDINTASSLHKAVEGMYVFAPVVVFKSQDGVLVTVADGGMLVASGGTVDTKIAVGSDLTGATHHGSALAQNTKIRIEGAGLTIDSPAENALARIGPDGAPVGE